MREMFTRMSKAMLWITGIAIVIGGLVTIQYDGLGLAIWIGGFILLWGIGTYVEMINNIMDIKGLLSKNALHVNTEVSNSDSRLSQVAQQISNSDSKLSQVAQQTEMQKQDNAGWFCRQCGQKNSSHSQFCSGCGKYK